MQAPRLPHPPAQPSLDGITEEDLLPLDLVKLHCKIDDTPGISDAQIKLYRGAAFEAAAIYTGRVWVGRRLIEQDIVSPRYRGVSQAAIARLRVQLDYVPVDGVVNVYGTSSNPMFWMDNMVLPIYRQQFFQTIILAPGRQDFEMANDLMFFSPMLPTDCNNFGGGAPRFQQKPTTVKYVAGPKDIRSVPNGILLGCLKYIAWSIENPGDQFVPMVVRQVGVTTISNDPAISSGAVDEWRRHRRNTAK